MVPRLDADALVDALALHVPAGRVPVRRGSSTRTPAAGGTSPSSSCVDTGVFDDGRYWEITADYAKASPEDVLVRVTVRNAGPEAATIDVLPTLWFRNTWSWGDDAAPAVDPARGTARSSPSTTTSARAASRRAGSPTALFCENETNARAALRASPVATPYPKDGIGDHVVHGARDRQPRATGTKAALPLPARGRRRRDARRSSCASRDTAGGLGDDFDEVMAAREREADEFYAELTPAGASADEALVLRQALAGMLWSKQFFHYDVERWLEGDPGRPAAAGARAGAAATTSGRT